MTLRGGVRGRTLLVSSLVGVLLPSASLAEPGEGRIRVLDPSMGPVVQGIFRHVRGCTVEAIAIRGGVVESRLREEEGNPCRVLLVAPGEPVESVGTRRSGVRLDVVHDPGCPDGCIQELLLGITAAGDSLRFVEVRGKPDGNPDADDHAEEPGRSGRLVRRSLLGPEASLALASLLGLVLGVWALAGLPRLVRRVLAPDHGWVLLALLGAAGIALLIEATTAALRSGDEWINQAYVWTALWSALDQGHHPHPAFLFEILTAVHGLLVFLHGVVTGRTLLDASVDLVMRHPFDLLVAGRVVSILSWLGVAGVTWRLASRLGGTWWTGFLAALIVLRAEQLYPTTLSPYPLGILLTVLAIEAAWSERPEEESRRSVGSARFLGAAIGTHYLAIVHAPFVLAALWLVPGSAGEKARRSLRWGLWVLAAFLVTNPRLFLDLGSYLHFWQYRIQEFGTFDPQNEWSGPTDPRALSPMFYWELFRGRALWAAMVAGALAFGALSVRSRQARYLLPVSWGILPIVLLSVAQTRYEHYLQFLLPGAAVLAVSWIPRVMPASLEGRWRTLLALPLMLLVATHPSIGQRPLAGWGRGLARSDPFGAVVRWVRSHPEVQGSVQFSGLPVDVVGPVLERRGHATLLGTRVTALIQGEMGIQVRWQDAHSGSLRADSQKPWITCGEITAVPVPPGDRWRLADWIQEGALEFRLWLPRAEDR